MTSSEETPSLKKLATRGAIWTIAGFGVSGVLRFGSNLILTRFLDPYMFGLMGLVTTFYVGLHMFSDVGINVSIIQNKRGDEPNFLNTAWTIQVIRGFILWGGALLLAFPVGHFWNSPDLVWLLPLVGFSSIITGFTNTALYSLNRHLALKQVTLVELTSQLFGTTIVIVCAWLSGSVWALAMGGLASALYQLLASYYLSKGKFNVFLLERSATHEILSFGSWIFVSTAMTFFAEQGDKLILSKVLGFKLFGIYGIAYALADLPRMVVIALSSKVIMPALSKIADQPRSTMRTKLNNQRKRILLVLSLGLAVMIAFGDVVITLLYKSKFYDAAWMFPILALGIWTRLLCSTNEPALFAIGKPQYTAAANLSRFICTALGIWIGYSLIGVPGAIIGVALNDLGYYVAVNYGLHREQLSGLKQDMFATGLLLCTLALLLALRYGLGFGTPINEFFT